MANGVLTLSGTQTGLPFGTIPYSFTINFSSISSETLVNLQSGANTITVPTGCAGCFIVPPTGNAVVLTLKGVTGDTGIPIAVNGVTPLAFGTAPASFVITAASLTVGNTSILFW